MKTIYLDADFRCHTTDDGTMTAVETGFFDGKCDEFIEGYRLVPAGCTWTRADGEVFLGEMIAPARPSAALEEAQHAYELERLARAEAILNELTGGVNDVHCE